MASQFLGAFSALFLSVLILTAIARQKTTKKLQKKALFISVSLLVCAIISNTLINFYIQQPNQTDKQVLADGIVLAKRVQASLDWLFGIAIGAFVVAITSPEIGNRKDLRKYMVEEFPNSYLLFSFVMIIALVTISITPVKVDFPNWTPAGPNPSPTIITFPLYFYFVMATGVMAMLTWPQYKLRGYLRKINATPSVRRDTNLIILGIDGYVLSELFLEVILPAVGIDLRSPGFILEIVLVGIIAYAVREKGFLQDLLMPRAEAHLTTRPTYNLRKGFSYVVVESSPKHSFEIFKDLVTHGAQGLCITRQAPQVVMQEHGLERTPILWLSRVAAQKNCLRPSPPENVAMAVEHFVGLSENSVVLIDGLEYLIAHNDFLSILALLHDLNENISIRNSILLLPVDPMTLSPREFAIIQRDLQTIEPPVRIPEVKAIEVEPEPEVPPRRRGRAYAENRHEVH